MVAHTEFLFAHVNAYTQTTLIDEEHFFTGNHKSVTRCGKEKQNLIYIIIIILQ